MWRQHGGAFHSGKEALRLAGKDGQRIGVEHDGALRRQRSKRVAACVAIYSRARADQHGIAPFILKEFREAVRHNDGTG